MFESAGFIENPQSEEVEIDVTGSEQGSVDEVAARRQKLKEEATQGIIRQLSPEELAALTNGPEVEPEEEMEEAA